MQKSAEAFRTISEVADDLDVPKHVLRFWEGKFSQLRPMKRGGGRRYYRPTDVDLLKGIRQLLYGDGYTIRGVQKVLRDNGVEYVKNYWRGDGLFEGDHSKMIPDIASETARRAVEPRSKPVKNAGKHGETKKPARGSKSEMQDLEVLRLALNELETCRKLLSVHSK